VYPKDDMPPRKKVLQDGSICWQDEEGKPHREDGPAVLWANSVNSGIGTASTIGAGFTRGPSLE
jgi:hypothetical protein